MAKQGTYFDPTADIVNDLTEAGGDYDNRALKRRGEMMRPILKAAIGKALKFGVKIVTGSDTGLRAEQRRARVARSRVLVAAGLTPLQALQAGDHRPTPECCASRSRSARIENGSRPTSSSSTAIPSTTSGHCSIRCWSISNGRIGLDRLVVCEG
jgi:hypothetical protein